MFHFMAFQLLINSSNWTPTSVNNGENSQAQPKAIARNSPHDLHLTSSPRTSAGRCLHRHRTAAAADQI